MNARADQAPPVEPELAAPLVEDLLRAVSSTLRSYRLYAGNGPALDRFVQAQAGSYEQALAELRRGRKSSHWMWFVFPQIAGLGSSPTAQRYAIRSLDEARAYLAHPVLGARLRECVSVLLGTEGRSAAQIFGGIDTLKLRSSMTLFALAATEDDQCFGAVLARFFDGERDAATERLVR